MEGETIFIVLFVVATAAVIACNSFDNNPTHVSQAPSIE